MASITHDFAEGGGGSVVFELIKLAIHIKNKNLFLLTALFIGFSSYFIHFLEPEMFETPFIGLWWVMTTVTTTGFGDYVPQTTLGRTFGIFLYLVGIGLIGIIIGKIVESFDLYRKLKEEGKLAFRYVNHFVIIGWSKKARNPIHEILLSREDAKIVVIDLFPIAPFSNEKIHYVQGDATERETLEKANVKNAEAVLIFAPDQVTDVMSADGKSLLAVSAVESYAAELNTEIYTIVEKNMFLILSLQMSMNLY
jgi:voltage-gated potassium channel